MMNLCATFEEWYLGDGVYPYLRRGDKVNLAFSIAPVEHSLQTEGAWLFRQIKSSEYEFSGQVIYLHSIGQDGPFLIVIDTGNFKFYIEPSDENFKPVVGQFVSGKGQLLVDYFIWTENLKTFPSPPNIFYNFLVTMIRLVKIPERFVDRFEKGFAAPASLPADDYADSDVQEINDMQENDAEAVFFLLDLKPIEEDVLKTFVF